jgi:N-acetylglucosamine malate deacetylase 1
MKRTRLGIVAVVCFVGGLLASWSVGFRPAASSAGMAAENEPTATQRTAAPVPPDDGKLRIICFGAHPDDCELQAGGTAALWAAAGHHVKFVSVTNGDIGHWREAGGPLARRRKAEVEAAAKVIGITTEVLDIHDGELLPTLENRRTITRLIREWHADLIMSHRPNDYHPDHRYTGVLVQDASYMVIVPAIVIDTPPLAHNPIFLYYSDRFTRPQPVRPDIVISIDDVFDKKINMLDAHVSQFYEWLPWTEGKLEEVPKDAAERKQWLATTTRGARELQPEWREALRKRYSSEAEHIQHAEAFEITEYGHQPSEQEIRELFPFFPASANSSQLSH